MPVHVAILKWPYLRQILLGHKTMESRFTKTARAPYQKIEPGERIYFKASGGPFQATAIAETVAYYDHLTPQQVDAMRTAFNDVICGDDDYWQSKRDCRYATLITFRDVAPIAVGPKMPPSRGMAWFVLDDAAEPNLFQVILTEGAIRNGYLRVPKNIHSFPQSSYATSSHPGSPVTLVMPDGHTIKTDLVRGTMFRWRGWSAYFTEFQIHAGDAVRFVQLSPRRYRVSFVECYKGKR
jgi:hypothetical protein